MQSPKFEEKKKKKKEKLTHFSPLPETGPKQM